jgi:hypothetical protein
MRGVIQGWLLEAVDRLADPDSPLAQPVKVDQGQDADGVYLPFFTVTLASGIQLEVRVTVVSH